MGSHVRRRHDDFRWITIQWRALGQRRGLLYPDNVRLVWRRLDWRSAERTGMVWPGVLLMRIGHDDHDMDCDVHATPAACATFASVSTALAA